MLCNQLSAAGCKCSTLFMGDVFIEANHGLYLIISMSYDKHNIE